MPSEQVKCTFVENFTPQEAAEYLRHIDWAYTLNFDDRTIKNIKKIITSNQVDLALLVAIVRVQNQDTYFSVVGGTNVLKAIVEENKATSIVLVEYKCDEEKEIPELYLQVNGMELPEKPKKRRGKPPQK